jgi:transposase
MRVLGVARCSARRSRTQAINQMRSLISTAPDGLRAQLRDLAIYQILTVTGAYRHNGRRDVTTLTRLALRTLARRALSLEEEVKEIDRILKALIKETAPELCAVDGIGPDVASAILVAAGDNPERLKNEATFAKLCGVSPLDASSGKQERHRLNRSGDRQDNSALWHIVLHPDGQRPPNPPLHPTANERRTNQEGGHPLPQALRGPRSVRRPPALTIPP